MQVLTEDQHLFCLTHHMRQCSCVSIRRLLLECARGIHSRAVEKEGTPVRSSRSDCLS